MIKASCKDEEKLAVQRENLIFDMKRIRTAIVARAIELYDSDNKATQDKELMDLVQKLRKLRLG